MYSSNGGFTLIFTASDGLGFIAEAQILGNVESCRVLIAETFNLFFSILTFILISTV